MAPDFLRRFRHADATREADLEQPVVSPEAITQVFAAPVWLRNLGQSSWLIVGTLIVLLGLTWLLSATSSIVMPVLTASIVAAVAAPVIGWLQRHRVPRGAGAALLIVGVLAVVCGVFVAVAGGVLGEADDIRGQLSGASDKVAAALKDVGIDPHTVESNESAANESLSDGFSTLVHGLAKVVSGLSSLALFVTFLLLSLFFLLKDGPAIRGWVERQLGIPEDMAHGMTERILQSLRGYFVGVTAIAVFNASVVSLGALVLGVPQIGAIAVVTFIGAYIPYLGAWAAGAFSVVIALGGSGEEAALGMVVVQLLANGILQQLVQPIAYGAALGIHPLAVLIVTIGGGALFGMVGLVLAAPLTAAIVRIVADAAAAREAEQVAEPPLGSEAAPA
jgi:predicted PurR-regulated permease PerM